MKMRESRVLKKLRAGEVVSCLKVNFGDGQVSELAAMAGFDCLWVDREHLAQDWSVVATHVWAAKAHNTDVMVRVPRGSYSDYVKPLELDAAGIMVPHCMGVEDARNVIKMTRFHPLGMRAIDGGNADGLYTNLDFNEYLQQANQQRFVVLQIEDPEPLDELDEIAALDGVDMLFFGPGDFSQAIGAPGEWNHPKLVAARKRVAEVCRKHGKFAATTGSIDRLEEFVSMGYQFVSVGADVVGMSAYCHGLVSRFNKETTTTQPVQGGYK
ncbi:4-hydroxy-2-oxoheptanedioate aldolase [Larkinella arboricola]|uniref:4-hydroxy-2-oxoheptanedioate aldolase n=1 Tax=Larkinella arboricola TaxID=643671 RepID=A0A327WYA5_LARAB|nr:aldolase/citrate lyase family protein [Larkinella arboricola]RAJ94525.1 4-hydroxy-2-oxoheptanedioate aldolase [Larkinella arboricola]